MRSRFGRGRGARWRQHRTARFLFAVAGCCAVSALWLAAGAAHRDPDDDAAGTAFVVPPTTVPTPPAPAPPGASGAGTDPATTIATIARGPSAGAGGTGGGLVVNVPPGIGGPSELALREGESAAFGGLVVDDVNARDGGSLVVLLLGQGVELEIDLDSGVGRAGAFAPTWVPIIGPIDALNRTLATLRVTRTQEEARFLLFVDDRGHGDLDRREGAVREIRVVDP